jgi:uncharacterized protein with HEPN domain
MSDKDVARIQHMLDSTNAIASFIKGKNRKCLDTDRLLLSGIIRELEILGEAAGKVSQHSKDLFPSLPWKQLIGMRNRLIHAYFDIDHDIIWKTITESLPALVDKLEEMTSYYLQK